MHTLLRGWLSLLVISAISLVGLSAAHAQQDRQLKFDQPEHSHIDENTTEETWTFNGYTGDLVVIDMRATNSSELDSYLTLVDPSGSTLLTNDDGGQGLNARLGPFRLPDTGSYTVLAGRYSGTGNYVIELLNLNTLPTIELGKPVGGLVDAEHPVDYFLLAVDDPDTLLKLSISDAMQHVAPILDLYGGEGIIATTEFQEARNLDPIIPLPNVRYVVGVSLDTNIGGGSYELELEPSDVSLLNPGQTHSGELDFDNYVQPHYFRGQAGDRFRITLEAEETLSLGLDVASADYQTYLFSSSGDGTHTIAIEVIVPNTGVYIIEVRDASYFGTAGRYTLDLDTVE